MENRRLALILAVQADVFAMNAANLERAIKDEALAYPEEAFRAEANHLRVLAYKHEDEL